jgi:hypothetical protein
LQVCFRKINWQCPEGGGDLDADLPRRIEQSPAVVNHFYQRSLIHGNTSCVGFVMASYNALASSSFFFSIPPLFDNLQRLSYDQFQLAASASRLLEFQHALVFPDLG